MKNKILLIIGLIILTSLTGCKGKEIKSDDEWNYTVVIERCEKNEKRENDNTHNYTNKCASNGN